MIEPDPNTDSSSVVPPLYTFAAQSISDMMIQFGEALKDPANLKILEDDLTSWQKRMIVSKVRELGNKMGIVWRT